MDDIDARLRAVSDALQCPQLYLEIDLPRNGHGMRVWLQDDPNGTGGVRIFGEGDDFVSAVYAALKAADKEHIWQRAALDEAGE